MRRFWSRISVFSLAMTLLSATPIMAQQCMWPSPTNDDIAVQAALDAAAAAGGGVVQLEPRVYYTSSPLVLGANTHLRGAGRGATIIQGNTTLNGKIVHSIGVIGTIASVASPNVTVSDLTIDHATCGRPGNGVEFIPRDSIHDGDVVVNGLVQNIEVLGSGNPLHHAYMIWNFKGRHIKIVNNWVNGGISTQSDQEGIESFGGHDVLISGNTVENIGTACINLGSADVDNSETSGITVTGNYLSGCGMGINHGTSNAVYGPQSTAHIRITDNTILSPRTTGINLVVAPDTVMRDITVSNNTVRDMNGSDAVGIRLRTSSSQPIGSGSVISNTVSGNHIENIKGTNSHGIRITSYPNVRVLDNTITDVGNSAIYTIYADGIEIAGNRIENGGAYPIQMHGDTMTGFARFILDHNQIHWTGPSASIFILAGRVGTIRDNVMRRTDSSQPTPVILANGTCGVTVRGNLPWYWMGWPGVASVACQ